MLRSSRIAATLMLFYASLQVTSTRLQHRDLYRQCTSCPLGKNEIEWLVGGFNPSEKYKSQLGWLSHILWKIKHVPNHQPDNFYRPHPISYPPTDRLQLPRQAGRHLPPLPLQCSGRVAETLRPGGVKLKPAKTGSTWWLTYPSEKIWKSSWDNYSQYMET